MKLGNKNISKKERYIDEKRILFRHKKVPKTPIMALFDQLSMSVRDADKCGGSCEIRYHLSGTWFMWLYIVFFQWTSTESPLFGYDGAYEERFSTIFELRSTFAIKLHFFCRWVLSY